MCEFYSCPFQVWRTSTSEFVRTLHGHRRGIACLQYRGNHVVSGSSDNTIRIWDIECGACLRMLEGHDDLVRYSSSFCEVWVCVYVGGWERWKKRGKERWWRKRESVCISDHSLIVCFFLFRCIRFDDKRIVSGAYDGYVSCAYCIAIKHTFML